MSQVERATLFRGLHGRRPLVLPNAWDVSSARLLEQAGASAVGTTSAGISWTLGVSDGEGLSRQDMVLVAGRIARAVRIPVTADVESGYGRGSPEDVAATVHAAIDAGVVGINLEDGPGTEGVPLLPPNLHAERIAVARATAAQVGVDIVINARTDVFLRQVGHERDRLSQAADRANLYLQAGADCAFVPGVLDPDLIGALVEAVDGPLNIMAGPGGPSIAELSRLGVARVSVGPGLTLVALAAARRAAEELISAGTYRLMEDGLAFHDVDGLFGDGARRE